MVNLRGAHCQKIHEVELTSYVRRPLLECNRNTETKSSLVAMVSVDTHPLDEQVKSMMRDMVNKMVNIPTMLLRMTLIFGKNIL